MKISKSLFGFFEGYLKLSALFQNFEFFIYILHELIETPIDVLQNTRWETLCYSLAYVCGSTYRVKEGNAGHNFVFGCFWHFRIIP
jgi:hypothetical protein